MKKELIIILLIVSMLVAATCTEEEAQQILSEGSTYTFETRESTDLVLVLDRSGSMRGEKILQAKEAATKLIRQLAKKDRAAVIGFDSKATVYSGFTDDITKLENSISRIEVGDFTRYTKALEKAMEQFNGNKKVIVFLTDGKSDDDEQTLFQTVSNVVNQNVCVFTIAYAESAEEEAQQTLRTIAETSKGTNNCGEYFRAGENTYELEKIFSEIYAEVSSDKVLEVTAEIDAEDGLALNMDVTSSLNQKTLDNTCFDPEISVKITRNNIIAYETTTKEKELTTTLPPGEYEYDIYMRETCGGECLFTGEHMGKFVIKATPNTCYTQWQEIGVLLTSKEYVEIQITGEGFSPQTIGTDGVVKWINIDDKPHRIKGLELDFESPILSPGESWSFVFPAGVYTYTDEDATFSGLFRNEEVPNHDPVDLIMIVDKSGSMAGTPLTSAKSAAKGLASILSPVDRASLIVFSDKARTVQQLTSDLNQLEASIDSMISEGSTYYIHALDLAGKELQKSSASRQQAVIFLSDGAPSDKGGEKAILNSLDNNIDKACLYSIGYGQQGLEAVELLSSMAEHVQEKNKCGLFYFSTAKKEELSKVFGEIYAQTQEHGLELYDIQIPEKPSKKFDISLRVRSRDNGVQVPSVYESGCIPPAEVFVDIDGQRQQLDFDGKNYAGEIKLSRKGVHNGVIVAKLSPLDDPIHTTIGTAVLTIDVAGFKWYFWVLTLIGLVTLAKIFMMKRNS